MLAPTGQDRAELNPSSEEPEANDFKDAEIHSVSRDTQVSTLASYVKMFGLDITTLSDQQLSILIAARNLEDKLHKLKIPVATKTTDGRKILVEEEFERTVPKTSYVDGRRKSLTPSDSMEVAEIESVRDLPNILPGEWLQEDVAPDEFYQRLASRELLARSWSDATRTPRTTYETIKDKRKVEKPAPPEEEKQHAYVLLDTSGSMYEKGKDIVSRGLTLAFFRQGYEQRAHLKGRAFTGVAGDLFKAHSEREFHNLVTQMLGPLPEGGTDIQAALTTAVNDIQTEGEFVRADILLVTDGLSYLSENPLGRVNLHTFIIRDKSDSLEEDEDREIRKIKGWSKSFTQIDTHDFASLTELRTDDMEEVDEASKAIPQRLERATTEKEIAEIQKEIAALQRIVSRYENQSGMPALGGAMHAGAAGKRLRDTVNRIRENGDEILKANQKKLAEAERKALEEAEAKAKREAAKRMADLEQAARDMQKMREDLGGDSQNRESIIQRIVRSVKNGVNEVAQQLRSLGKSQAESGETESNSGSGGSGNNNSTKSQSGSSKPPDGPGVNFGTRFDDMR